MQGYEGYDPKSEAALKENIAKVMYPGLNIGAGYTPQTPNPEPNPPPAHLVSTTAARYFRVFPTELQVWPETTLGSALPPSFSSDVFVPDFSVSAS